MIDYILPYLRDLIVLNVGAIIGMLLFSWGFNLKIEDAWNRGYKVGRDIGLNERLEQEDIQIAGLASVRRALESI